MREMAMREAESLVDMVPRHHQGGTGSAAARRALVSRLTEVLSTDAVDPARPPIGASGKMPPTAEGQLEAPTDEFEAVSILEAARRGELVALERLYAHYIPKVYSFALDQLASTTDAEEVAQKTLLRIYLIIGNSTVQGSSLDAWVVRIATNEIVSCVRKQPFRVQLPLEGLSQSDKGWPFDSLLGIKTFGTAPEVSVKKQGILNDPGRVKLLPMEAESIQDFIAQKFTKMFGADHGIPDDGSDWWKFPLTTDGVLRPTSADD